MSLCVGISGGHNRSQAIALIGTQVVGTTVGPSLNHHIYGIERVLKRTNVLLDGLRKETGHSSVAGFLNDTQRITVSLPGVVDDEPHKKLAEIRWRNEDCLRVVDDTWAGLIGGALDRTGVCAIAGTGASVFVGLGEFPFGKPWKLDGLGPILGDWGSGFRLATRYLEEYGRHYDRFENQKLIPLFEDLLARQPDIKTVNGVQKWFDRLRTSRPHDWHIPFSKVAAVVTDAAAREKPDPFAVDLVRQSARELARTIQIGLTRAERALAKRKERSLAVESLKVVCIGGQFWYSTVYFDEVRKAVGETFPKNEVILAKFTPVVGAALMAYAEDRILPARDDLVKIGKSILAYPSVTERGVAVLQASVPPLLQ